MIINIENYLKCRKINIIVSQSFYRDLLELFKTDRTDNHTLQHKFTRQEKKITLGLINLWVVCHKQCHFMTLPSTIEIKKSVHHSSPKGSKSSGLLVPVFFFFSLLQMICIWNMLCSINDLYLCILLWFYLYFFANKK